MSEFFDGDAIAVSKYFKKFQTLLKECPGIMTLKGDNVLVEKLPKVELKTKSGLIIGTSTTHKNTVADSVTDFGLVLMTGPGQVFEDGSDCPCDAKPGDIILLPQGTYWYGAFGHISQYEPYSIGRLRDGQIPMWFTDYKKAFEVLNG
jgi:co-chaperonin GroES (HSP10)